MDKIILVCYIGIGSAGFEEIEKVVKKVQSNVDSDPKLADIIHYYIPVRTYETRIECINPKLVSEEDYIAAKEALSNMQEKIKQLFTENENKA